MMLAWRAGLAVVAAALSLAVLIAGRGPFAEEAAAQGSEATNTITGTVTKEDGTPLPGLIVGTTMTTTGLVGAAGTTRTASDGSFSLRTEAGPDVVRHLLYVDSRDFTECTVSGYRDGEIRGEASFTPQEGDIEGLRIVLTGPARNGPPSIDCLFATPLLRIEGSIVGHDGKPIEGVSVRASGTPGSSSGGPWIGPATGPSGTFTVEVPDGTYKLGAFVDYGDAECDLGDYRDGEVVPRGADISATRVDVPGHVIDITMALPLPLEELCRRVSGAVQNARGEPLGGRRLAGQPVTLEHRGELRFYTRTTPRAEDGTFTLYVAEGPYSLRLVARSGDGCHLDPALLDIGSEGPDQFIVGDRGVAQLRVIVSGLPAPRATPNHLPCSIPLASITTQLQPGWNLAGWTDIEAPIEALFADIPALRAAYAWDAEAQAFRAASRRGGDVSGDLVRVTPGMGLWLSIGGDGPVEWTRPVVAEGAQASLAEGWNLVAWSGEDGTGPAVALGSLGLDLQAAAGWDPASQQFRLFTPAGRADFDTLDDLRRGQGIWVYMSTERDWLQGGVVQTSTE